MPAKESWRAEARRLKFEENKSWTEIAEALAHHFPSRTFMQVRERIRSYIRELPEYKQRNAPPDPSLPRSTSLEYKADGSIVSERFIILREGQEMTPEVILKAHGLDPAKWEVVSYRNNFWNSQLQGGDLQISYQSRVTARPRRGGLDLEEIDRHFARLERKRFTPPVFTPREGTLMAEVNIADLHLGKLCCVEQNPEEYNCQLAEETFLRLAAEICAELRGKPLEYITFPGPNDFFHFDTKLQTTTKGTPQDTDVLHSRLFNVGTEMLVRCIEMLVEIAPVHIIYVPSNHDELMGYHAIKFLEAWFRQDPRVTIDASAYPRKYQLYGKTLIGYAHGDKEGGNGTREKASRLASLMPIEAKALWGQADYHEMHAAHLHSEQMIQEINGVIVRRISSPAAADTFHTEHGYLGAVRKAQTFIYDKTRGLVQIINTPVERRTPC